MFADIILEKQQEAIEKQEAEKSIKKREENLKVATQFMENVKNILSELSDEGKSLEIVLKHFYLMKNILILRKISI